MSSKGEFYRWLARLARDPELAASEAPVLEAMIAVAEAYAAGDDGRADELAADLRGKVLLRSALPGWEFGSRPAG